MFGHILGNRDNNNRAHSVYVNIFIHFPSGPEVVVLVRARVLEVVVLVVTVLMCRLPARLHVFPLRARLRVILKKKSSRWSTLLDIAI